MFRTVSRRGRGDLGARMVKSSAGALLWALAWLEWGPQRANAVLYLPLVLPPVVVGYLLLLLLGARGPIGHVLHALAHGKKVTGPLSPKISRIGQQIVDSAGLSARLRKTVKLVA